MKRAYFAIATIALAGWISLPGIRTAQAQFELAEDSAMEGVEELTRGPVHEAFANPLTEEAERLLVPQAPPEPIAEEPAELRPEGENIVWIPGYWAWDADREDFLWVSGVWRQSPPNHRWTPGYWVEGEGGWVWVAGFWAPNEVEELRYYAPPPESLEAGPSSPSPGDNYFWVTGCWVYRDDDFRWQAGYWAPLQPDWVWVPANWVWTPAGYVFLPGRWDYPWVHRGCLYTPVHFANHVYQRPGFVYRPRLSINLSATLVHLWVRPSYGHYYFGDYYAPRYRDLGFASWTTYASRPRHYDPLLTYYQTRYRRDGIDYVDRMRSWHDHYVRRENERPPGTWREQANWARRQNIRVGDLTNASVATSLLALPSRVHAEALRRTDSAVRFTELSRAERERATQLARNLRTVHSERADFERQARRNLARPDDARPRGDRDGADRSRDRTADRSRPDVRWKLPQAALEMPHVVGKEPTRDAVPARDRDPRRDTNARPTDRDPRGRFPGETGRDRNRGDLGRGDLGRDDPRTLPAPGSGPDARPGALPGRRPDATPRPTPDSRAEEALRNLRGGRGDSEKRTLPAPGSGPDARPGALPGRRPDATPRPTPDSRAEEALRNLRGGRGDTEKRTQPFPLPDASPRAPLDRQPRTDTSPRTPDSRAADALRQLQRRPEIKPESPRTLPSPGRAPVVRPDSRPDVRRPEARPQPRVEQRRPEIRPEPRVERNRPAPQARGGGRGADSGPRSADRAPKGNPGKDKKRD